MFYVYVIKSLKQTRFYVGLTNNLERRMKEHNSGKTRSTRFYRPWSLVFSEIFESRVDARKREVYLKSGIGKEIIKNWPGSSAG